MYATSNFVNKNIMNGHFLKLNNLANFFIHLFTHCYAVIGSLVPIGMHPAGGIEPWCGRSRSEGSASFSRIRVFLKDPDPDLRQA